MGRKHKWLSCLLSAGLLLGTLTTGHAAGSQKLKDLTFSSPEQLASPCGYTQTLGGSFGVNEKGEQIFYGVCQGNPAQVIAYNVDTATAEDIKPLQGPDTVGKAAYAADVGPDGRVYIAAHQFFFIYDPATKKVTSYPSPFSEGSVMNRGTFDQEGYYYFGTYPNASLVQFNLEKNALVNLGDNMVRGQYVRAVASYGDKIFMGSMGTPDQAQIVRYDVNTKETKDIPLPEYNEAARSENAILRGTRMEEACAPKLNTGMFAAMKEAGDVMGMFVGHDHDNDYAVMWKDILLAYGRFTGGNTEYNHLPNGARIIVLDEGARTFTSWIRQKDGVVDKISYPASFVKDDWTKR